MHPTLDNLAIYSGRDNQRDIEITALAELLSYDLAIN
jgi:hypothetical protein